MLRHAKTIRHRLKTPASGAAATVIITSNTGFLAEDQLTVRETWQPPAARDSLVETAMRAAGQPQREARSPLDAALATFVEEKGARAPLHPPLRHLAFSHAAGMSGNLWHNGGEYILAVKGAPEHVLARCDPTEEERERAEIQFHKLAGKGHRVVALAHRVLARQITSVGDLAKKEKLEFDGLLAVSGTIRPQARRAVASALSAGTAVYLITGEHPEAAYHHGRELGIIRSRQQAFDARRLEVISDGELDKLIGEIRVFSRATPEQKQRIVAVLEKRDTVVMPAALEDLY